MSRSCRSSLVAVDLAVFSGLVGVGHRSELAEQPVDRRLALAVPADELGAERVEPLEAVATVGRDALFVSASASASATSSSGDSSSAG